MRIEPVIQSPDKELVIRRPTGKQRQLEGNKATAHTDHSIVRKSTIVANLTSFGSVVASCPEDRNSRWWFLKVFEHTEDANFKLDHK